jgi:hypothetical protein
MTRRLHLRSGATNGAGGTSYRCGAAARWLPMALAAGALATGFLAGERLVRAQGLAFGGGIRWVVVGAGAALALWVLKAGSEARLILTVDAQGLHFKYGRQGAGLAFEAIDRLDWEPPLARSRMLFPALLLRDRYGRDWRLPVVLEAGPAALRALLDRSAREDLATWAETLALERRMGQSPLVVAAGYALAALMPLAAAVFYFR